MSKAALSAIEGKQASLTISRSGDWGLDERDTRLVKMLIAINRSAWANGVEVDDAGLPMGARQLVTPAMVRRNLIEFPILYPSIS